MKLLEKEQEECCDETTGDEEKVERYLRMLVNSRTACVAPTSPCVKEEQESTGSEREDFHEQILAKIEGVVMLINTLTGKVDALEGSFAEMQARLERIGEEPHCQAFDDSRRPPVRRGGSWTPGGERRASASVTATSTSAGRCLVWISARVWARTSFAVGAGRAV